MTARVASTFSTGSRTGTGIPAGSHWAVQPRQMKPLSLARARTSCDNNGTSCLIEPTRRHRRRRRSAPRPPRLEARSLGDLRILGEHQPERHHLLRPGTSPAPSAPAGTWRSPADRRSTAPSKAPCTHRCACGQSATGSTPTETSQSGPGEREQHDDCHGERQREQLRNDTDDRRTHAEPQVAGGGRRREDRVQPSGCRGDRQPRTPGGTAIEKPAPTSAKPASAARTTGQSTAPRTSPPPRAARRIRTIRARPTRTVSRSPASRPIVIAAEKTA